ncbi:hypothetical protein EDC94DRAFT_538973 [Helicostylum pulchrum]|nr:hypothetical protein EDC94DRAFT_538973 [Helicostylum pulchrum]
MFTRLFSFFLLCYIFCKKREKKVLLFNCVFNISGTLRALYISLAMHMFYREIILIWTRARMCVYTHLLKQKLDLFVIIFCLKRYKSQYPPLFF